jgi:hypothetical protein
MSNSIKIFKICAVALLFLQTATAFSQTKTDPYTPDSRLYDCMKRDYVDKLSADRSELLLYYNYYLSNSYYVVKLKNEKPVTGEDIHTVTLSGESGAKTFFAEKAYNAKTFNVMKYQFTRKMDGFTTYVWKEAGVALVFYPTRQVQANFNNYLKSIAANQ